MFNLLVDVPFQKTRGPIAPGSRVRLLSDMTPKEQDLLEKQLQLLPIKKKSIIALKLKGTVLPAQ